MGFLKRLRLKSHAVPTLALTKRRNQQFRRLEPKVTQEIGCPTEPVTCKSKATQAKASNRSVSCDTGTLTEHSFPESPRACSTSLKRKRWELSTNDLSNQMDGSPSTVNSTSTCEVSQHKGKEYIVNEDQLLKLFQRCPVCGQTCTIEKSTVGTLLRVNQLCRHCDFHDEWSSQPLVNSIPVGKIQLRAAVLFTSFCQKAKERNSSLNQAEPEPPQIKEELCSNQEGEQLVLNQQTDVKEEDNSECEETLKICGNIMSDFNEELDQDCSLQNTIRIPETPLLREGAQNKWQLCNQEMNSSLDQPEPEPPQIKEEPEELCSDQEGEQMLLNQEDDVKMEFKSDLLDHQHHQRNIITIPVLKLQKIELPEKHINMEKTDDEQLHWKQERSSSLDEEEPDLPQVKEEWEEVCISEEGKQLELKQDTDAFMVTEHDQEKMESKQEPSEIPLLEANTQIRNSDAVTAQLDTHESSFSCDICGKCFTKCGNLKTHMKIHTGERPFTCKVCEKSYTASTHLKVHMRTHTGERPFSCKVCKRNFTTNYNLKCHMITHTCERPFSCEICKTSFKHVGSLARHMSSQTGGKLFTCKVCEKSFNQSCHLKVHLKTHTRESRFLCEICKKTFIYLRGLTTHMRSHTGEKPFSCKICNKSYVQNHHFRAHMRTHTGEKPFTCEVCPKRFLTGNEMKMHLRTHTGERPFSCKICKKRYTQNGHFRAHMRTHSGERPFSCEVCEKSFTISSTLKVHMRTHTGEMPFSCKLCDKRYSRKISLKIHMKTHTGEPPFSL